MISSCYYRGLEHYMKLFKIGSGWTFGVMMLMAVHVTSCRKTAQKPAEIKITNAWTRPVQLPAGVDENQTSHMDSGTNGVIYLTIENDGDLADRLLGARSEVCQKVEIHETVMSGDHMSMKKLDDEMQVAGHGKIEFKPRARHFMLLGMNRSLAVGDSVRVLLSFQKSGTVEVFSRVRLN